ncbi:MAG: hypothetical protein JO302_00080 [Candidatus Eremiobacteraeota bacterium]|nr:hypothetical protein [Candidatus Eremiobacteraeota bacterium]
MGAAASPHKGGTVGIVRIMSLVFLALLQFPIAAHAGCDGANPAITAVTLQGVNHTPHLDLYHVTAKVTNLGNRGQSGDVLQFVDVVQYDGRLDDRGIPPLAPGQSYTVTYVWPRSSDAGKWTSPLDFRIRTVSATCAPVKGSAGITV